jgi:hypothetical protein
MAAMQKARLLGRALLLYLLYLALLYRFQGGLSGAFAPLSHY